MLLRFQYIVIFISILLSLHTVQAEQDTIKIGVVTPLTGPLAQFAPSEGTILAIEEINAAGGIKGRKIELVIEDGKCDGKAAATAVQKLISIDHVRFILGGHCSVETLAIAPIAERNHVLILASMSTSSEITAAGDYIFRTSPSNFAQGDLLAHHAIASNYHTAAVLAEESPFAVPLAKNFSKVFAELGGQIVLSQNFSSSESDLRSSLVRLKTEKPDVVFVAIQSVPFGDLIVRQMKAVGIHLPLLGTEPIGNVPISWPQFANTFEGIVFAQPDFDLENPRALAMIQNYKQRFNQAGLRYPFQADAYDAARLLTDMIGRCGTEPEAIRDCLYKLSNYSGITGPISFDKNGDRVLGYTLRQIKNGKIIRRR